MSLYRYYFFDSANRLKSGNCAECFNDQVAIAKGSALLTKELEAVAVEIWRDEQFIGGERRDGVPYVTSRSSDISLRTHPIFSLDKKTA